MEIREMEKYIINMSEEKFEEFAKGFSPEQVKVMQAMRFFNKLYSDKTFYKAVEKAVGEVAYEELRAQ
jgi:hypothetical protein